MTFGCQVSLYSGEHKMESVLCEHNKADWIKVGTKRASFKNYGHPILIGDVLERIEKTLKDAVYSGDPETVAERVPKPFHYVGLEGVEAELLRLCSVHGFTTSLQAIAEQVEWEKGCDEPYCDKGHYPLGMNEDGDVEWGACPKCKPLDNFSGEVELALPSNATSLFIFLKELGL